MEEKKKVVRDKSSENIRAIRWEKDDWEKIAKLAAANGMTRSGFIKKATAFAATMIENGWEPAQLEQPKRAVTQDVSLAKASTHLGGR